MGERLLHGPQLLGHDPPHHGLQLADLDAFRLGRLRLRLEGLEQSPLDPRADRHAGLAGPRHRRLAHLVTDAADRPTPGQTGSSRPHGRAATLALQLHSALQVRVPCGGLVRPSPERPGDDVGGPDAPLREADGDAAEFLDRPADEVWPLRASRIKIFGGVGAFVRWRTTASMAKASITSETWRYQPCQERVSLWSRPSSVLAVSNASSIVQRSPSPLAKVSIAVPAGHRVVKKPHSQSVMERQTSRPRVHKPV